MSRPEFCFLSAALLWFPLAMGVFLSAVGRLSMVYPVSGDSIAFTFPNPAHTPLMVIALADTGLLVLFAGFMVKGGAIPFSLFGVGFFCFAAVIATGFWLFPVFGGISILVGGGIVLAGEKAS